MKNRIMKKLFGSVSIASLTLMASMGLSFAASTATRSLSPTTYTPGSPVTVTNTVTPHAATLAYALQDTPPTGWTISAVDNSGNAVGGVVKWGVYFDATARTVSYQMTPPAGTTGTKTLTGTASFDGGSITIGGTSSIALLVVPDTTNPIVSMTAPAAGNVSGSAVAVSASASDNIGVVGVQFKLDGANLGAEDTTAPYSVTWNSTLATIGTHALTAVARDAAGNTATSAAVNVTVLDGAAPTSVSLTAPAAGAVLSGSAVTLSGTATDNVGVTKVEFYSGVSKLGEDTSAPFTFSWDTTAAANGGHSLTIKASDAAGNVTTSAAVVVSVANAAANTAIRSLSMATYVPGTAVTVTIMANPGSSVLAYGLQDTPPAGWTISAVDNGGTVNGGVVKWGIYFDNTARTFSYKATPPAGATGSKTFTGVISFDGASSAITGTTSIAGPSATPDTTKPVISITSPVNNAQVSGTISIAANATDNIGVVGVQFKLDGVNLGSEDLASAYSISWNTSQTTNGNHTLTAVARDAAGNTQTSASVVVIVNNAAPTGQSGVTTEAGFLTFKNVLIVNKDSNMTISYSLANDSVSGAAKSAAVSSPSLTAGSVALKIYDRLGNEVKTLGQGSNIGGSSYQTVWDGRNSNGELVASGTYILVLNQGSKTFKRKIVVVK